MSRFKSVTKIIGANLLLILVLLALAEIASYLVWTTGAGPQKKLANRVFGERLPANFNLSGQEILALKVLDDVTTEIALPYSKDGRQVASLSFYVGDGLHVMKTERSLTPSISNFRKYRDVFSYDRKTKFWSALERESTDRKIVLALGGSTTAFSWGWPSYLAQYLEAGFPGQFLVLNLGQPGDTIARYRFRYESHVRPILKEKNRTLHSVITLDGVNDLAYPVYLYINSQRGYPTNHFCQDFSVDPGPEKCVDLETQRVLFSKDAASVSDSSGIDQNILDSAFYVLPYSTALIWHWTRAGNRKSTTIREFIDQKKDQAKDSRSEKENLKINPGNRNVFSFSDRVHKKFFDFYLAGIETLRSSIDSSETPILQFLQPVTLPEVFPLAAARTRKFQSLKKGSNYRPTVKHYMVVDQFYGLKGDKLIGFSPLFSKMRQFAANTDRCCFYDISTVFSGIGDLADDPYSPDGIHFDPEKGSRVIAQGIYSEFKRKFSGEAAPKVGRNGTKMLAHGKSGEMFAALGVDIEKHQLRSLFPPGFGEHLRADKGNKISVQRRQLSRGVEFKEGQPLVRLSAKNLKLPPIGRSNQGVVIETPAKLFKSPAGPLSVAIVARAPETSPSGKYLLIVETKKHWSRNFRYCGLKRGGRSACAVTLDNWDGKEDVFIRVYSNVAGDGTGIIVDELLEISPPITSRKEPYRLPGEAGGLPSGFVEKVRPSLANGDVLRIYRDVHGNSIGVDKGSTIVGSNEVLEGALLPLVRVAKTGLSLPPVGRNHQGIVMELPAEIVDRTHGEPLKFAALVTPARDRPSRKVLFIAETQSAWNKHFQYCDLSVGSWTACKVTIPNLKQGEKLYLRLFANTVGDNSGIYLGGFLQLKI